MAIMESWQFKSEWILVISFISHLSALNKARALYLPLCCGTDVVLVL